MKERIDNSKVFMEFVCVDHSYINEESSVSWSVRDDNLRNQVVKKTSIMRFEESGRATRSD